MPILQRIRFSDMPALQALYFRTDDKCRATSGQCTMGIGAVCNLDSFYNACFLGRGGWPPSVGLLTCKLVLEGDFHVSILFRSPDGVEKPIQERRCSDCISEEPQVFPLFEFPETDGRVYAKIRSLRAGSVFWGGTYGCSNAPSYDVCLGIVICTCKREKMLLANLEKLASDPSLRSIKVVVIDNGRTLDPSHMPEDVSLITNPNLGGAGGFSRGLIALARQGRCSHALLMDDDVQLDTEAVLRCLNSFSYTPECALAGTLLTLENPCIIHEAGADLHPVKALVVKPLLSGADLAASRTLDLLQKWKGAQYGGFWFFAFPMKVVRDLGALLPFFLKADDIEFGLRLRRASVSLSVKAGVGVHHPGFTGTVDPVKRYYWVRNIMIVHALYDRLQLTVIAGLFLEAFKELRYGRKDFLLSLVRGLEDFLEGPGWLRKVEDQLLIASLNMENRMRYSAVLWFGRAMNAIFRILILRKQIGRLWQSAAKELASLEYWRKRIGG
jgi:galactofuranosylgalactofuranosylrhamnosyl-N-acetylglucosaminyl-diphospho-decaprenol beta-1,5/1,6-galactofuranosyltransferase